MLSSKSALLRGVVLSTSSAVLCSRCLATSRGNRFLNDLLLSKPDRERRQDGLVPASLTAALECASSQREVLDLLDAAGDTCGLRHLIRATKRLAYLRPRCLTDSIYTPHDGLYRLEAKLCSRVEKLSITELCQLLHYCSRMALALPNNDLLTGLCLHLRSNVKWMSVDQVVDCLHSLAILQSRTVQLLEKDNVLAALEQHVVEHMNKINDKDLGKAVWSFHRLSHR